MGNCVFQSSGRINCQLFMTICAHIIFTAVFSNDLSSVPQLKCDRVDQDKEYGGHNWNTCSVGKHKLTIYDRLQQCILAHTIHNPIHQFSKWHQIILDLSIPIECQPKRFESDCFPVRQIPRNFALTRWKSVSICHIRIQVTVFEMPAWNSRTVLQLQQATSCEKIRRLPPVDPKSFTFLNLHS